jgi:hypothetical protein
MNRRNHNGIATGPVQFDLTGLSAQRIERRVSNSTVEIRCRFAGNLDVAAEEPFENLMKNVLR